MSYIKRDYKDFFVPLTSSYGTIVKHKPINIKVLKKGSYLGQFPSLDVEYAY